MKFDAKEIKENLTVDDIISIVEQLDGSVGTISDKEIIFDSVCHNVNTEGHSQKLYYYIDTKSFHCFVCGFSGDIFALIKERWNLCTIDGSFIDILNYCVDNSSLNIDNLQGNKKKTSSWSWLEKYEKKTKETVEVKTYDNDIINLFPKLYHQSWIDDGITIKTMEKFNIRYYPFGQAIVIPVYNQENNLVGIHCRNLSNYAIEQGRKYMPLRMIDGSDYRFSTSTTLYGINENKQNIKKAQSVIITESPKSVLQCEEFLDSNICVALFGLNLSKYKRNMLLELGVENFYISIDKQYKKWYNHYSTEDNYIEFNKWVKNVNKLIKILKGYGNIYIICDTRNLLEYKDSPTDKGVKVWNELFERKPSVEKWEKWFKTFKGEKV